MLTPEVELPEDGEFRLGGMVLSGRRAYTEGLFVCLAAVSRSADFLIEVGWFTTEAWEPPLHLSAVLRSWEDRFGARLLQIGPRAKIRLLVSGPPRTEDAALAVAAELWAFGDRTWVTHSSQEQVDSVADIASLIIDQPIWGFWWG